MEWAAARNPLCRNRSNPAAKPEATLHHPSSTYQPRSASRFAAPEPAGVDVVHCCPRYTEYAPYLSLRHTTAEASDLEDVVRPQPRRASSFECSVAHVVEMGPEK